MSEHGKRHQWIGGLVIGGLAFVMGMGFTEGKLSDDRWMMPLFWAVVIGLGFIGLAGD